MFNSDLLVKSRRVLLYDELQDYQSVIEHLSEHLKTHPQNHVAYNNRGLAYSEIGRGVEALLDFTKALECSADDPIPYVNRGGLRMRRKLAGMYKDAIDDYKKAVAIKGDDPTFHRCLAHACLKADRLQEAIDAFTQAISLDPEFGRTYQERGEIYSKIGEMEKAKQDFKAASKRPQSSYKWRK